MMAVLKQLILPRQTGCQFSIAREVAAVVVVAMMEGLTKVAVVVGEMVASGVGKWNTRLGTAMKVIR